MRQINQNMPGEENDLPRKVAEQENTPAFGGWQTSLDSVAAPGRKSMGDDRNHMLNLSQDLARLRRRQAEMTGLGVVSSAQVPAPKAEPLFGDSIEASHGSPSSKASEPAMLPIHPQSTHSQIQIALPQKAVAEPLFDGSFDRVSMSRSIKKLRPSSDPIPVVAQADESEHPRITSSKVVPTAPPAEPSRFVAGPLVAENPPIPTFELNAVSTPAVAPRPSRTQIDIPLPPQPRFDAPTRVAERVEESDTSPAPLSFPSNSETKTADNEDAFDPDLMSDEDSTEDSSAETTSSEPAFLPIDQIKPYHDYAPPQPKNSSDRGVLSPSDDRSPAFVSLPESMIYDRQFNDLEYMWEPANLFHNPLYFEDPELERYGHTSGQFLQPLASVGRMSVQLIGLPYQMTIDPPDSCQSPLGYHRPGECVPARHARIGWNPYAAVVTGLFYTGIAFLP